MAAYEDRLQALGRLLDERIMRDVVVTEDAQGYWVAGLGRTADGEGDRWMPMSLRVSLADLDGIARSFQASAAPDRKPARWRPW